MSEKVSAVRLPIQGAVEMAYCLADYVAAECSSRALLIKGPIVRIQGFRGPGHSTDADVLVEPDRFDVVVAALQGRGWVPRRDVATPRFFAMHSVTMYHPEWPCDIDVHFRYPGFFGDPTDVFEALWERRTVVEVANRRITCTDAIGSALILSAHALREPSRERSRSDILGVQRVLGELLDSELERELVDIVTRVRGRDTLRPVFDAFGVELGASDLSADEWDSWRLVVAGTGSTAFHWWVAFRRASWWKKPAVLIGAPSLRRCSINRGRPHVAQRGTSADGLATSGCVLGRDPAASRRLRD